MSVQIYRQEASPPGYGQPDPLRAVLTLRQASYGTWIADIAETNTDPSLVGFIAADDIDMLIVLSHRTAHCEQVDGPLLELHVESEVQKRNNPILEVLKERCRLVSALRKKNQSR